VHKVPAVYFIQNNLWAESVPLSLQTALTDLSDRAKAYGMPGITIDGNDVLEVYETASKALTRARNGEGPTLIEGKTYRWYGHSEIDPANYRSDEEVASWKAKDPLPRYEKILLEEGVLKAGEGAEIQAQIAKDIEEALTWAEAQPYATPETAYTDVFAPGTFGGYA
jgi:TPP-dependent pyruvate/acetoin dehydrogenase alpha subunit